VATVDGESISQHFGQSSGFIIFNVEGGEVRGRELWSMRETPHVQGLCDHHGTGQTGGQNPGVSELLSDCGTVVCGGMGAGAAEALRRMGMEVLIVGTSSPDDVVAGYLSGKLTKSSSSLCNCHH
jgi:predicted Fe-Mo cluster-binding NifX family protein